MGLKQTGAAPACHNSQGPTLPACEKRDLNPRNPFSWVRRILTLLTLSPIPIFSPKPLHQQHTKQNTSLLRYLKLPHYIHTYLQATYFILESIRYFIFLLSIIHSLLETLPPSLFLYTLTFSNTLSHEHIDVHVIHPNPHHRFFRRLQNSTNPPLNQTATAPGSIN